MSKAAKRASDVINALFGGVQGLQTDKLREAPAFMRSWADAVGEKIASHSRVIDVDRGVVVVEVDHPGWSQQILFRKKTILSTLSRQFPGLEIKNLMMRVSSECVTPYIRQEGVIGEGVRREQNAENTDESQVLGDIPDEPGDEVDSKENELERVLARLKKSIERGKPSPS